MRQRQGPARKSQVLIGRVSPRRAAGPRVSPRQGETEALEQGQDWVGRQAEKHAPRAGPRCQWARQAHCAGRCRGDPRPRRRPRALQRHPASPQAVVGDSEYHHFRYRIPPARVRLLEVGGDLQLDSVKIF